MIRGIGVDIVSTVRIAKWIARYDTHALSLIFTRDEIEACRKGSHPERRFAACFAIKEAVGKALGTGLEGIAWTEIESRSSGGRIGVFLHGAAEKLCASQAITNWAVTVTGTDDTVVVAAIAESL